MRVLYLSAWYPTEKDQMAGLFVKKHAEAVRAQGVDVKVLGYEPIPKGWKPDLIQLNVLSLKNALRTYWLHLWFHVPYVIVEHWTRYLPSQNAFPKGWEGCVLRFVAKRASMLMSVSKDLQQAMRLCGIENRNWQVVNNVVDDFFYESFERVTHEKAELLHISCFDEPHKNVCGMLRVVDTLWKKRQDWHLTIVGTGPDYNMVRDYACTLSLPASQVTWTGELMPPEVCEQFKKADVFVLFSNVENAPVVLSESLAMGCPIVSSNVGGIAEMISEKSGILVEAGDEKALLEAIEDILDHPYKFSRKEIRESGLPYSVAVVGRQLMEVYQSVISN